MSLEDVRCNVQKVQEGKEEIDTFVYMTIKITKKCKEEVLDPAIEMARAEYGDTVDSEGEPQEISPGRAIEMICADYIAGVHGEKEDKGKPFEEGDPEMFRPRALPETTSETFTMYSPTKLLVTETESPEVLPEVIEVEVVEEATEAIKEVGEKISKGRERRAKMFEDVTLPAPKESPFSDKNFDSWYQSAGRSNETAS
jgi:hypothetical protein